MGNKQIGASGGTNKFAGNRFVILMKIKSIHENCLL